MTKTDNIFMDALNYGVKCISEGVSYDEMKTYLTDMGWKVDGKFENYFIFWFFSNFYHDSHYKTVTQGNQHGVMNVIQEKLHHREKAFMTSEAFDTYQDFEKLKQAKIDTRKAQKTANWALWLSGGLAGLQVILQIIQMVTGNDKFCLWCAF